MASYSFPTDSGFSVTSKPRLTTTKKTMRYRNVMRVNGKFHSIITSRMNCESERAALHQKLVVESPSLNSPEQSGGDGWCWANLQNTHFSGLTRKSPVFERSVLMYVSIKNRTLTQSGQKSRVCVNQPDRLTHTPPANYSCLYLPCGLRLKINDI